MTKMIFLIGRTGRGKSALANVLVNKNGQFEETFKESSSSVSKTRDIQGEEFEFDPEQEKLNNLLNKLGQEANLISDQNDLDREDKQILRKILQEYIKSRGKIKCFIVDTPGIGDTRLSTEETLDAIAEAVYLVRDGISQVLFITNERFDSYEVATYNLLRTIIFDQGVTNCTTIVKTNFPNFEDDDICGWDVRKMKKESWEIAEVIKSCNGIIHVDNPSLSIKDNEKLAINKDKRNSSREILLAHLSKVFQEIPYKPPKLKKLSEEISHYMEERRIKKKHLKSLKLETIKKDSFTESKQGVTGDLLSQTNLEEKSRVLTVYEHNKLGENDFSEEKIKMLFKEWKDWQKAIELKERILKLEEQIRGIVRKHILNNSSDIRKVIGGDGFLDIIIKGNSSDSSSSQNLSQLQIQIDLLKEEDNNHLSLKELKEKEREKKSELTKLFQPKGIFQRWQKFKDEEIFAWVNFLIANSVPEFSKQSEFCFWLKKVKGLEPNLISQDIKWLVEEYFSYLPKEKVKSVAQEWLDKNFPLGTRKEVKKLHIYYKNLIGKLDLSDFVNLEDLDIADNEITELNIKNCVNLEVLNCNNNLLTNLSFLRNLPDPKKIKWIDVYRNQITLDNLDVLSPFVNCEFLSIGKNNIRGNLSSLRFWNKLKRLDLVKVPELIRGLEYLAYQNSFDGVDGYEGAFWQDHYPKNKSEYEIWKRDNMDLINRTYQDTLKLEKYQMLEIRNKELKTEIERLKTELNKTLGIKQEIQYESRIVLNE